MKRMLVMAGAFVVCVAGASVVQTLHARATTLLLTGQVEGFAPEGRGPLAFHFFDEETGRLAYRTLAEVVVSDGEYSALVPVAPIAGGGTYLVGVTPAETSLEEVGATDAEVAGALLPLIPVWLQSSTPGTQQIGHANISGTLIAGAIETGAFRMAASAGAGKVLTSDASGNGTWQDPPPPSGSAGGDLGGTYPNPTVAGLHTRPVSSAAPGAGQVLKWTGSEWAPAADDAGGLTLPFSGSANVGSGAVFSITNTATSGVNYGVFGRSDSTSGLGVFGRASATSGVNYGVFGESASTSGYGGYFLGVGPDAVYIQNTGSGRGLRVSASDDTAIWASTSAGFAAVDGRSVAGRGVFGWATATSGANYGGFFQSNSTSGFGMYGLASATSGVNHGGFFVSHSTSGRGVVGAATATSGVTYGGRFESQSTSGRGVFGLASANSGEAYGVSGLSQSTLGRGVYGLAAANSGTTYGVYGESWSANGFGVYGIATGTTSTNYGGFFVSSGAQGIGVLGAATATSGPNYGGRFESQSTSGRGVFGVASAGSGATSGVYGLASSPDSGSYGVRGSEPAGGAGHAVFATGTLAATGTKSFQIDHPLDPVTFYLNHFCTEGPAPMNAYSGNVVTDAKGYATIALPDYFESINRDFRYQLTIVDDGEREDFVLVKVVRKIQDNQFTIRTSAPRVEVSWRVEAIRNDRWVQAYGYQTVQEKEDEIKGRYLHPELFGMPERYGIHYRPDDWRPALESRPPPASRRGSAGRQGSSGSARSASRR